MRRLPLSAVAARALGLLLVLLGACETQPTHEVLTLTDLNPRQLEVGDRVELLGSGFPLASDVRRITVTLRGALARPGLPACARGVNVTLSDPPEGATTVDLRTSDRRPITYAERPEHTIRLDGASRLEFVVTEGLLRSLTTCPGETTEEVPHATLAFTGARSGVEVQIETLQGTTLSSARPLRGPVVDVHGPSARRLAIEVGARASAERALTFMGLQLAGAHPQEGGLQVERVRPGSPAEEAGLSDGDVLEKIDGATLLTVGDFRPAAGAREAVLSVRRGDTVSDHTVRIEGFSSGVPMDLVATGILLVVAIALVLLFMAPTAGILTWVERRIAARMQSRIGPNRVGPEGFLQWLADGIKSIAKADVVPTASDQALFRLAPYLVFIGVASTFVVMPFGQYLIAADLDVGILYVVAVTSLVTIGLMTGGWASNNKWSLLGGIRAASQIISYEVPAALSIVCVVMLSGTLRMQGIIEAQGGAPWEWYLFRNPITFALFFLYFTAALAESNRTPFDLPEAESELVAGYSTEYSGMRYVFFFFAEWANVFVMCGIATSLFLGGWQLPFVSSASQEASTALQMVGAMLFMVKAWVLVFVVIWIRWTLPRIRIDQVMTLCWKYLVPATFASFLLLAGGMVLVAQLPEQAQRIAGLVTSIATFLVCGLGLTWMLARRVSDNLRKMPAYMPGPFA